MMEHLTENELEEYLVNKQNKVEEHIENCPICFNKLSELKKDNEMISELKYATKHFKDLTEEEEVKTIIAKGIK